ncbi:MAG TPA: bifunctional transaldolase/phosoglucose isomerase [Solirubrobacteraceae bacterium]|nr:bifunctional transaldolase/phosoglucose isomerase [Solirubrobacteraceae bacterium]
MSTSPTIVNERLAELTAAGTAVWLDQISRELVSGGDLARLTEHSSLRGVTSNPAIFEKAILGSSDYDDELAALARDGRSAGEIYDAISIADVQLGCDVLAPVWERLSHRDGFVSLEVHPALAHDGERTLSEARRLWAAVDRPNLMIKIPGTPEGVPAIEQALTDGINVNVTLLFGVEAYAAVADAYIRAMERRLAAGDSLDVHSVASFFVSRVDSEVDKRLADAGAPAELRGRAGVANARAAYLRFEQIFGGERFATLRAAGAVVQRPLWASTGVKDPAYPATLYVDGLVGPDTVNTMPMATLEATAAMPATGDTTATAALDPSEDLRALAGAGIDMDDVTDKLLADGIVLFADAFDRLLAGVEAKRAAIAGDRPGAIAAAVPAELQTAIAARVERAGTERVVERIWDRDATLWAPSGTPEVADRLGWLTIAERMRAVAGELTTWAASTGALDVVLLGMGGSSLAPEVLRRSFAIEHLHVLDSTDPGAIRALEQAIDLETALFVVSSKSGGTIETLSHFAHFWERSGGDGSRFVAVTDPGSPLEALAAEHGFLRTFAADPEIGGRYSALSYFGLVPAALAGIDIVALLAGAETAETACRETAADANPGLWLGCALGELALAGRDKLTFVVDEPLASFGLWAEQLIAESTGKLGRGILPVADEPLGAVEAYGDDRVFLHLRAGEAPDAAREAALQALEAAGHPVLTLTAGGPEDLGRIFFLAEFATAVAGWALGINPFDQPNVQEAKDATARVLEAGDSEPPSTPALAELLADAAPPRYVAILGYVPPTPAFDEAIVELRRAIRDTTRATTTFGYGPRYLHSTGQFHKGGPAQGLFVELVHDGGEQIAIPGKPFGFAELEHAQALGDLQTLLAHGLGACRLTLDGDPAAAVRRLAAELGS